MFPYSELLCQLQHDLGDLTGPPCTARSAAKAALYDCLLQKLEPPAGVPVKDASFPANAAALEKFIRVNESVIGRESLPVNSPYWSAFKAICFGAVYRAIGERSTWEAVQAYCKLGPGANFGVDSRGFYTKLFEGDLSATHPYLLHFYKAAIATNPLWVQAEELREHYGGCVFVEGNSLFFVSKKDDISRVAASEPVLNLFAQMGVGGFLQEEVLKNQFGIDLRFQQELNRAAALKASIDGKQVTIDLSSASDMNAVALGEATLPRGFFGLLMASRSPVTILPDGTRVPLKMISTMGNGFTFPLETLFFASAVKAVYAVHGKPHGRPGQDYCVFGDDIIVDRDVASEVVAFLGDLGFKVNVDKTFFDGPFRESCGVDAWEGVDIRPVFIRGLETDVEKFSAFNRLARWSVIHKIPLPRTLDFILSRVKSCLFVPYSESDCAGIKVPLAALPRGRVRMFGYAYTAMAFVSPREPVPDLTGCDADKRFRVVNPPGWELAFIAGYVRSNAEGGAFMPIRAHNPKALWFRRKFRVPYWDWNPPVDLDDFDVKGDKVSYRLKLDQVQFDAWKRVVAYAVFERCRG